MGIETCTRKSYISQPEIQGYKTRPNEEFQPEISKSPFGITYIWALNEKSWTCKLVENDILGRR